jgi:hypothetical protein
MMDMVDSVHRGKSKEEGCLGGAGLRWGLAEAFE